MNLLLQFRFYCLLFAIQVCLGGCIPVEEIEPAWSAGKIDPVLEGSWKSLGNEHAIDNSFITFVKRGDAYEVESQSANTPKVTSGSEVVEFPPVLVRSLTAQPLSLLLLDGQTYMTSLKSLMGDKTTAAVTGGVMPYKIIGDELTVYTIKPDRLAKEIAAGEVRGAGLDIKQGEMPYIKSLDATSLVYISNLLSDTGAWIEQKYVRVESVEKSLEQSRTYQPRDDSGSGIAVYVDAPSFQSLCDKNRELLRRHLQASPEWNVFQEGPTDIVIHRRQLSNNSWLDTSNGYFNSSNEHSFNGTAESERFQIRYLFRLNSSEIKDSQIPAFNFKQASPTEGRIELKLKENEQGIESYLTVGCPGMWFEFFEQSENEDRVHTRQAVQWLAKFTSEVVAAEEEIENQGYSTNLMPPGAIVEGDPSMTFSDGQLIAHLNPGRQGFVFLKAIDLTTSRPLNEDMLEWRGKEYIGWSQDKHTQFPYYKSLHALQRYAEGKEVRIELWFRPTNGHAGQVFRDENHPSDVKMLETTLKM